VVEGDASLAAVGGGVAPFELQRLRIDEDAAGVDDLHFAALRELGQTAGEGGDHFLFAFADFLDRELRLRELDAPFDHFAGFADHLGDVEQRLRRDAAAEEAGASEARVGLDDRCFEPQVGRHEGRRIPAGTAAEHHYLRMHTSPRSSPGRTNKPS
jgi:hypothetical protein